MPLVSFSWAALWSSLSKARPASWLCGEGAKASSPTINADHQLPSHDLYRSAHTRTARSRSRARRSRCLDRPRKTSPATACSSALKNGTNPRGPACNRVRQPRIFQRGTQNTPRSAFRNAICFSCGCHSTRHRRPSTHSRFRASSWTHNGMIEDSRGIKWKSRP